MFKILSLACLLGISCSSFITDIPDAIRCGNLDNFFYAQNVQSDGDVVYCNRQTQCIKFSSTGVWKNIALQNFYATKITNCKDKSLAELQTLGRTYNLARAENQQLSEDAELNDFLQTKLNQFKDDLLDEIKNNGLKIGARWKINQQGQKFAIQDTTQGYRIAFAPPAPAPVGGGLGELGGL